MLTLPQGLALANTIIENSILAVIIYISIGLPLAIESRVRDLLAMILLIIRGQGRL